MDQKLSLLLVEPDASQHALIQGILNSEFQIDDVTILSSSMDTMNLISKQADIQCIIIASNLHDSCGFSLTADIRSISKYSKIPILLISETKDRENLLKAAASGASDFIIKPFNQKALTLKLKKLLAGKQFRKSTRISTLEAFDAKVEFLDKASYDCKLVDISTGGCSLKSEAFTQGGAIFDTATISIGCESEDKDCIRIDAELARMERDPECENIGKNLQISGFQFQDVTGDIHTKITDFIAAVGK